MFVELIDVLRCPAPHEESWLVSLATRTVDRHVIEGTVGCPVCGAEYEVRNGAVWFPGAVVASAPAGPPGAVPAAMPGHDDVVRLAALLGADDRPALYLLFGSWSAYAAPLLEVTPLARILLVSPPGIEPGMSAIHGTDTRIPIAARAARGIVLERWSPALLTAAVDALCVHGRLVAPADAPVPDGITVLGRDDRQWVGECDATPHFSAPVSIRRG